MTFHSVLSTFLSASAYGVFNPQLIRYARPCRNYADFWYHARLLTITILEQGYVAKRLKTSLQKFYGRHHELVDRYYVSIFTMRTDLFNGSQLSFPLSSTPDLTFYESLAGVSRKHEDAYPIGAPGPC